MSVKRAASFGRWNSMCANRQVCPVSSRTYCDDFEACRREHLREVSLRPTRGRRHLFRRRSIPLAGFTGPAVEPRGPWPCQGPGWCRVGQARRRGLQRDGVGKRSRPYGMCRTCADGIVRPDECLFPKSHPPRRRDVPPCWNTPNARPTHVAAGITPAGNAVRSTKAGGRSINSLCEAPCQ